MNRSRGITLIALVITIVVLIILAGVAISLSIGENGIFKKAEFATEEYANEQAREEAEIAQTVNAIDQHASVGGTRDVTYCTTPATTTSTASITNPCVVIENYRNGASWYRVWSDGWIEQGGSSTGGASQAGAVTNLLKPYSDVNYTLIVTGGAKARSNAGARSYAVTSQSTNNFKVSSSWVTSSDMAYNSAPFCWYACGY